MSGGLIIIIIIIIITISSEDGPQQGDPLSPLLFCNTIQRRWTVDEGQNQIWINAGNVG